MCLKDEQYYNDLYDKFTVERCRFAEDVVNKTFVETKKEIDRKKSSQPIPGLYLFYSITYFQMVEALALMRFEEKAQTINSWMERDQKLDNRLESAIPKKLPYCPSCGRDMGIIHKHYMSRYVAQDSSEDEIMIMFECKQCNKRKAYWEDGSEWVFITRCEKCNTPMDRKSDDQSNKKIVTTYSCPKCKHSYSDILDLNNAGSKKEPIDPYYELDRKRFCIDESMAGKIKMKARQIERMINLQLKSIDRVENHHVYTAIEDIKKLKIAQLSDLLRPLVEKEKYSEFNLGEPQFGREVLLSFSCLDNDRERAEYESRKNLEKLISKALDDTNWRLMSDGISYRLGHLSGRLRAYETEGDLRKLAEQRFVKSKNKPAEAKVEFKANPLDLRESCLTYFQNMTMGTKSVDEGKRGSDYILTMKVDIHEDLRIKIPPREDDENVPEFVRNFDFTMVNSSLVERKRKKKDSNAES